MYQMAIPLFQLVSRNNNRTGQELWAETRENVNLGLPPPHMCQSYHHKFILKF